MKLRDEFSIAALPAEVWTVLVDVERVASCLPGAAVTGVTPDGAYEAEMRVKVGPVSTSYSGTLRIVEQHDAERHAILEAEATETRGQGSARAQMSMQVGDMVPTPVSVATELDVTGRVAQLGPGIMQDVATRLMAEFARNLEAMISNGDSGQGETSPVGGGGHPQPEMGSYNRAPLRGSRLIFGVIAGRLRAMLARLRRRVASLLARDQ